MGEGETMPQQTVVLYGAGNTGRDVLELLRREGTQVPFFLDARATPGMHNGGIPVYPPEQAPATVRRAEVPLIVTVFNWDADVAAIAAGLRAQDWRTVTAFSEFHARHAGPLRGAG